VVETNPPIKGATAQAQTKAAKLETGITIPVPSTENGSTFRSTPWRFARAPS
jgi:hypothetical protein